MLIATAKSVNYVMYILPFELEGGDAQDFNKLYTTTTIWW